MVSRTWTVLTAFGLSMAAGPVLACDLQPKDRNPASVSGVEFTRLARAVNDNFNSGARSARNYDLVDPLDGMTLGFGNWPQQEVAGFFADMKSSNGGKAFITFTDCLHEFFAQTDNADIWGRAQAVARVSPGPATRDAVAAVLEKTLFNSAFMARYRKHCSEVCKPGEPDLYHEHEAWLKPALRHGLRDRTVIAWQVDFWTRTIVGAAVEMASTVGLKDDEAGVVAAAAYRSSAPAWFKPVAMAARSGTLTFRNFTWNWNAPPAGAGRDAEGLKSWRRFILWQHYAARVWIGQGKRRVRDRSRKFFADFLAAHWLLPARRADGSPDWNSISNLDPALVRPRL
ncbi:MAG: hypothetical protein ACK4UO_03380 [Pseudolabrys sp.]